MRRCCHPASNWIGLSVEPLPRIPGVYKGVAIIGSRACRCRTDSEAFPYLSYTQTTSHVRTGLVEWGCRLHQGPASSFQGHGQSPDDDGVAWRGQEPMKATKGNYDPAAIYNRTLRTRLIPIERYAVLRILTDTSINFQLKYVVLWVYSGYSAVQLWEQDRWQCAHVISPL